MGSTRNRADRKGVFLIGDRPICRFGMAQVIGGLADLQVCGEADEPERALPLLQVSEATIAVIDLSAPPSATGEIVKVLHRSCPQLPLLVVGAETDPVHALRVLRAGAKGFITKRDGADEFVAAIRKVLSAQVYLSPIFSDQLIAELARGDETGLRSATDRLSEREVEVLRLLGEGRMTRDIAEKLGLSIKTVETHRARIKEKLGIRTATELLRFAMQWTSGN